MAQSVERSLYRHKVASSTCCHAFSTFSRFWIHEFRFRSVQTGYRLGTDRYRSVQIGTDRYRSVQIGSDRFRSVQIGTDRYRSVQIGSDRFWSVLNGRFRTIQYRQATPSGLDFCNFRAMRGRGRRFTLKSHTRWIYNLGFRKIYGNSILGHSEILDMEQIWKMSGCKSSRAKEF